MTFDPGPDYRPVDFSQPLQIGEFDWSQVKITPESMTAAWDRLCRAQRRLIDRGASLSEASNPATLLSLSMDIAAEDRRPSDSH